MKILAGSHSTGKSTLLEAIQKKYPDYYTTDGFSRPVKIVRKAIGLDSEGEQILINELTTWAFENYINKSKVISARSPIDAIVYSKLLTPTVNVKDIENRFDKLIGKIETVFFIPIEFPVVNDGVRFIDPTFQQDIQQGILDFLQLYRIPYVELSGTVEERLAQMEHYL